MLVELTPGGLAARDAAASQAERPVGVATSTPYLPELEGLRGVAMLMVLIYHTAAALGGGRPMTGEWVSPLLAFVRAGNEFGVPLFFVLSSFLLTLPFLRAAASGPPVSVRRYFERRALRILPAYYAAVVAGAVVSAAHVTDLTRALPYFLFLNSFSGVAQPLLPFSHVWWSLATECQFYLVLPLAAWLCRTRLWLAQAGLAAWLLAYAAWITGVLVLPSIGGVMHLGSSLFGFAPCFLGGAVVAWLHVRHGAALRERLARAPLAPYAADLALLVLLTAIAYLLRWVTWFGTFQAQALPWHAYHVPQALLYTALLAIVMVTPTHARDLLSGRVIVRLGVLSYSMYLLHLPLLFYGFAWLRSSGALSALVWSWRSGLAAAGLWALCIGLAECTYRGIERPFLVRKEGVRG
jgi:peptidoglycan/LPS O-acetylase OafA/YrhL